MASVKRKDNGSCRVRWRDESGASREKNFDRKADADRYAAIVTAGLARGTYVDVVAGRETFQEYAERHRQAQPYRPSSTRLIERQLRLHAYPLLGHRPINRFPGSPAPARHHLPALPSAGAAGRGHWPAPVECLGLRAQDDQDGRCSTSCDERSTSSSSSSTCPGHRCTSARRRRRAVAAACPSRTPGSMSCAAHMAAYPLAHGACCSPTPAAPRLEVVVPPQLGCRPRTGRVEGRGQVLPRPASRLRQHPHRGR